MKTSVYTLKAVVTSTVILLGSITLLFIMWEYATAGPEASHMAMSLSSEISEITPPPSVRVVTADKAWEPHRAHVTKYYAAVLTQRQIEDYYTKELARLRWQPGPGWNRKGAKSTLVYHKAGREFRLTMGSVSSGWTYEISLIWRD